ncbi:Importin-alpha re-exporter [Grifola frondosa]|uniref:Importin-alpha re-exporter n=1 Tax=Grifola frondosa TaxID=5627 RepID=A0A1C7M7J0_GRIFR|nr:Importin-alpha re-exporter [Grifola frondosa]
MAELPSLLLASLNPSTRKQAENNLKTLSVKSGFLSLLLRLALDQPQDRAIRLAGSVYLKNVIKSRWEDVRSSASFLLHISIDDACDINEQDEPPIQEADKATLREELVPAMIALSGPSDKAIRAQVAESISLIASCDFPERWPDLVDKLVFSLSETNYDVNIGVLETAHSIFRPWRAQARSDELFTMINYVLSRFTRPFLQLFLHTASLLFSAASLPNLAQVAQAQAILIDIFYDLTCQDLPPDLEDTHEQFFGPETGLFLRLLLWDSPNCRPDDTVPSIPSQIKTGILEIVELYVKLYPEILQTSASVEAFVRAVWDLVGGGKRSGVADDGLVSQSLRFISTAIRTGHYKPLFGSKEIISSLVQGVVVPNITMREHDIEQFEDDPLEYIRLDLALPSMGGIGISGDAVTRRQAAADVVRALVASGLESEATEVAGAWIGEGLREYSANKVQNWRAKDTAIYLLTAVATRGSTTLHGVTSTNALVDVVQFFSDHVFQDLQADMSSVHPILQVDAIRFLYTFRNQLVKPQLLSVLPLLVRHLASDNYVCYTYAAISIERILFIKQGSQLLFSQADIQEIAPQMLDALLSKIESAGTPEKVAENDYLMKCTMRVIITARSALAPAFQQILQRLVGILGVISKNPSNPIFDQYIFESISALMRFAVAANPSSLATFESALFGPFTIILQQDIDRKVYSLRVPDTRTDARTTYRGCASGIPQPADLLAHPPSWQQKGSIPGLVKLLKAFLSRDSRQMVATGQFTSILAVVQQRLIPSKLNDSWGFELLQSVVQNIPPSSLKQYFRAIIVTLLQRMQTSKTDKYVYHFVYFLAFTMALNIDGLGPDYVVGAVEEIQPQLWSQILSNFVIPQAPKMPPKDRKVVVVGLTRLLTQSALMLREPTAQAWWAAHIPGAHEALPGGQHLMKKEGEEDLDAGLTQVDFEEQTAGYQVAYSRLAASETVSADSVAYVRDPREFLGQELVRLAQKDPRVKVWVGAVDVSVFMESLAARGYQI